MDGIALAIVVGFIVFTIIFLLDGSIFEYRQKAALCKEKKHKVLVAIACIAQCVSYLSMNAFMTLHALELDGRSIGSSDLVLIILFISFFSGLAAQMALIGKTDDTTKTIL